MSTPPFTIGDRMTYTYISRTRGNLCSNTVEVVEINDEGTPTVVWSPAPKWHRGPLKPFRVDAEDLSPIEVQP